MQEATQPATSATAQQAGAAPTGPTPLAPARSFTLTTIQPSGRSLTPEPGGEAVCLLSSKPAINLWKSLVAFSPEVTVVVGCLLTLLVLRRVARRPQELGERYCRRCNYQLKLSQSVRCPECGGETSAHNVMRGARRKPRIILLTGLLFAFAALYLSNGLSPLRYSSAADWLDWRSTKLAEFTALRQWNFASAGLDEVWSIDRVNLQTGSVTSTKIDARDKLKGLAFAADGRSVAVWGYRGVYLYSWPNGKPVARMTIADARELWRWSDRLTDARFSTDFSLAYVCGNTGTVEEWDLDAKQSRTLIDAPSSEAGPLRFVSPESDQNHFAVLISAQRTIAVLDRNSPGVPPHRHTYGSTGVEPLVSHGARSLVTFPLTVNGGRATIVAPVLRGLSHGDSRELDAIPPGMSVFAPTISPGGRWLIMERTGLGRDLFVWEIGTGRCALTLTASGPFPIAFAPISDSSIVRMFQSTFGGGKVSYQLDVFELPFELRP